jgi:hypothetical protein
MRFLPYVLVAFMAAPIAIWLVIEFVVLGKGSLTRMAPDMIFQAVSLGAITVVAFVLLAVWMSRMIARTSSRS